MEVAAWSIVVLVGAVIAFGLVIAIRDLVLHR